MTSSSVLRSSLLSAAPPERTLVSPSHHPRTYLTARPNAGLLPDLTMVVVQVSEEEKLKPLHDNTAAVTENLYAERLAREVPSPHLCLPSL